LTGGLVLSGDTTVTLEIEPYLTSITENPEENRIKIWPNPVSESLNISIPASFANGTLEILNLQGVSLKKFYPGNQLQFEAQVHGIPTGIYLLKFVSKQNQIIQQFVKN
jgi:hypothetical protein